MPFRPPLRPQHHIRGCARFDDAERESGDRHCEPNGVVDHDGEQTPRHVRVMGDDDVERDDVEDPGDVGQRAGHGGGGNRETSIEASLEPAGVPGDPALASPRNQPGRDSETEEQRHQSAEDVRNAFGAATPRMNVDPVEGADHQDAESDREGQSPDYVRRQQAASWLVREDRRDGRETGRADRARERQHQDLDDQARVLQIGMIRVPTHWPWMVSRARLR